MVNVIVYRNLHIKIISGKVTVKFTVIPGNASFMSNFTFHSFRRLALLSVAGRGD